VNLTKSGTDHTKNMETFDYSQSMHVPTSPGKLIPEQRVVGERPGVDHNFVKTEVFSTDNEKTTPLLSQPKHN
jgi:hypothetical protein